VSWRRPEIEKAVAKLPIRHENLWEAQFLVDHLALIGAIHEREGGDGLAPPNFRPANEKTVRRELVDLEARFRDLAEKIVKDGGRTRAREQLSKAIQGAHSPTIKALGDVPAISIGGEPVLADLSYFQNALPRLLAGGGEISAYECLYWSEVSRIAQKMNLQCHNVGRAPNRRAQIVAGICAQGWLNLTGREPTFTVVVGGKDEGQVRGDFLEFVKEIFGILKIQPSPLSYASCAAFRVRGRGRKK
jgi:hypothetical protein